MSKELDEKRKLLASILEQKKILQAQQKEHIQILNDYLPVKDAYQFYKQGKLSEADFQSYKNSREALEVRISGFPSIMQSIDTMIERLKSEIKEFEKQEKQELRKGIWGKIFK